MSVILRAPATFIETTSVFPDPEFSDVESSTAEVKIRRSMNGTKRTYVKKAQTSRLTYNFRLTRAKALEMRAFIESYYRVPMYLINHLDEVWYVWLTNNPFEFAGDSRADFSPGGEFQTITLNFEGNKVG